MTACGREIGEILNDALVECPGSDRLRGEKHERGDDGN
jgi:hypothetical protein